MQTPNRQAAETQAKALFAEATAVATTKTKPALNAVTHGLTAATIVLKHENAKDYAQILVDLRLENRPRNSTEDACLNQMAHAYWKVIRVAAIEKALWELEIEDAIPAKSPIHKMAASFHKCGDMIRALDKLNRYAIEARRAYHQAATTLRLHQKWAEQALKNQLDRNLKGNLLGHALADELQDIVRYKKYQRLANETDATQPEAPPPPR